MDRSGPSLVIGFDLTRTQARLQTVSRHRENLASLLAGFPGGQMTERLAAAVPIDEFIGNIEALTAWPEPDSVAWEESFQTLAMEMIRDAERSERLLSGEDDELVVRDSELMDVLEPAWSGDLTAFQCRDVAKLVSLGHGANFSVPGAGKTRVALAGFSVLRGRGRVTRMLVVCPKSAYEAWQEESQKCFTGGLDVQVFDGRSTLAADVLLVNYERLDRSLGVITEWIESAPTMMILDEAHRMKLGTAGVYGAACMALGPLSTIRMILTGTPAPNGPKDLESLFAFVWPGRGKRVVNEAIDGGNLVHASRVLKPLYTRTTKQELGLPPVSLKMRMVDLPPLHREIYDAIVGRYTQRAERSRSDFDSLGKTVLRLIMAATSPALLAQGATKYEPLSLQVPPLEIPPSDPLYSLLGSLAEYEMPPKYQEVLAIVKENSAQGRKTLVWASFVRSISTLETLLGDFRPAVVHGGTADREEQIDFFRSDPDCLVLISNPATLGEGISLHQVCHDAVYVDRDFQAGRFLQSLDRIHRLGLAPDTETRVTVLATRHTVDEVVAMRLNEKLEFMGKLLDDASVQQLGDPFEEPSVIAGMDAADVKALLRHVQKPELS
ncbi:DNA/RNA helicase [Amycolatopsis mediterranei S699]|uniref:DNA/RNA helicase n=2 Tax=Amycolatopsis mediterranei TaxID=33910 RepID=A0A0H3DJ84_AMYMU|nr:DEAD/DEAH box helicase [Amycolatopsis mediterranei]ADJ50915.1 DNA/RNA helicase [Amycolatopsis mediterranei U32]AEK47929.1 DNA/RNA helicase [Amycolatopsis mediterranei S699]AFO82620.1 DNA/RNA helicase [Amycolatopsis mediterranei S699]AGT89749.1 DNA/RNA helicase [Amycolatopsis mediterranei RB]KDO12091.1 DNA helicase [Amycolatopsis mediterranei]